MSLKNQFSDVLIHSSLIICLCLPFLIFFDPIRNIDLQGILLIVAGLLAWLSFITHGRLIKKLETKTLVLMSIFIIACLLSLLVNPHKDYGIFGAPYLRLGFMGLLACISIGVASLILTTRRLVSYLYVIIVALGLASLPYAYLKFHSFERLGGLVAQADVIACISGCGFILGLGLLQKYPERRWAILAGQALLGGIVLLTQTRAVILLLIILTACWYLTLQPRKAIKHISIVLVLIIGSLVVIHQVKPGRLTDANFAKASINYRLDLQTEALEATTQKALFGYGPGNLADALDCSKLEAAGLKDTCSKGYFFNSSHNIFLDRILMIGWPGGLAYLSVVLLAIYRGLKHRQETKILAFAIILIAGYYLTNVTSVILELLLWVLIVHCLSVKQKIKVNRASA